MGGSCTYKRSCRNVCTYGYVFMLGVKEIALEGLRAGRISVRTRSVRLRSGQEDALLGQLRDLRFLQFVAGRNFEERGMRLLGGGGLAIGGLLAGGGGDFGQHGHF